MSTDQKDDLSFPQRATIQLQHPNPLTEAVQRQAGPLYFRDGENVEFMRAEKVLSAQYSEVKQCLNLEVQTKLYINRTAQTHDSVMHQFIDGEADPGTLWFRLYFFSDRIFRVQYAPSANELDALQDDPEFPFPTARMLVGASKAVPVEFDKQPDMCMLSSSTTSVRVQYEPFQLSATDRGGKVPFWKQRLGDIFTSDVIPTSIARHQGRAATFESFSLSPGESIYGLGERFDSPSRRGRPVDFVNHDAIGTSNLRSYINVPFFWSTAGYGCFVNSYARTEWDVGMSETGALGFSTEETFMDYFIVGGKTPKDIIRSYTEDLTGRSKLPPTWTFGLWMSRNSYTSWAVVDDVIEKATEFKIPLDVIHLDTFWFEEDWCPDLRFDPVRFGSPETKMAQLLESGIHTSLWQYSFVINRSENILFQEGVKGGYFATNRDGTLFSYPAHTSGWKTDDAVIDFSNPAARKWYASKIRGLIEQGATAIKTDFGDCNPPAAHYHSTSGRRFQNSYTLAYNATVADAMREANPGNTVVWARSGTAGSQRYPIHWGGDSQCSWTALQGSFFATLSMGLSGFTFFASDTGGFIGKPDSELFLRWAQMSMLSASHFRSHGAGNENSREPWTFGEEALRVFRKFADLRYRLLPYLVEQSRKSCDAGIGLVRHLVLEWPEDRNVRHIDTQSMLGDGLMVAPILKPLSELEDTMHVYFPSGRWFDFWTGILVADNSSGLGTWIEVPTPALDQMAIWVRGGTAVCFAKAGRLRTYNEVGAVEEIQCYDGPVEKKAVWDVPDGQGGTIQLVRNGCNGWVAVGHTAITVSTR